MTNMTKILILTGRDDDAAHERHDASCGVEAFISKHGDHFNEKLLGYATGMMRRKDGTGRERAIVPFSKAEVDGILERNGVTIDKSCGLDYVYVANMAKADFWKSSIDDERHLALYIKDVIDDVDAPEGHVLRRWAADMEAMEMDVNWEELA